MAPIYLDHNATTPVLAEVVDAMLPYLREHFGNPSSQHVYGQRAQAAVERARQQVAALLRCDASEIIFTSGGTEANNLAIRGVAEARDDRRHIVTSVIEHPATARPCDWLVRRGTQLRPFVLGAGHERGLRPGTENVAFIVGLGLACEIAGRDLEAVATRMRNLRDELWARLLASIPEAALNGHPLRRLPNTLSVRLPRASGNEVLAQATAVAAATGSACHAGHESASGVILAMGVAEAEVLGTVRLTLGRATTADDVSRAADSLVGAWRWITAGRAAGVARASPACGFKLTCTVVLNRIVTHRVEQVDGSPRPAGCWGARGFRAVPDLVV